MEYIKEFETRLINYLNELAQKHNQNSELVYEVLIDKDKKHYQLVRLGWRGAHYLYSVLLHFEIQDGKIWILQNLTESAIGQELVNIGIPPDKIVLGFQPEHRRPYTGFAVA